MARDRRIRGFCLAAVLSAATAFSASAETYPSHAIKIFVGFGPASSADILARLLAKQMEPKLGEPVVVENRPGNSSMLAADTVARAAPDGYALFMATIANTLNPIETGSGFNPAKDLAPIALLGVVPNVLAVHPSVPAQDLKELIELAKTRPDSLIFGTSGDEMTRGVSQWITPLELPNHTLSPKVQRACQALSLDDERTTFHPVLWNERNQPPQQGEARYTRDEKVTQVWFAGVHSNVGGGYPDDSLARIPLYWIMEEAKACHLIFKKSPLADPDPIVETRSAQDKDGRLYDSRSGLGIYYRFGPRRLYELCHQKFSRTTGDEVHVQTPKIHESVLKRIQNHAHVYAPIGVPAHYDVVVTEPSADGESASFRLVSLPDVGPAGQHNVYELAGDAVARVNCERRMIWPSVYLRAGFYYLTVIVTIAFVMFPFSGRPDPLGERESALRWMSDIIRAVSSLLPGWASQWMLGYAEYPMTFIVFGVVLGALVAAGSKIASYTGDQMTLLWRQSLGHTIQDPGSPDSWQHKTGEAVVVFIKTYWKYAIAPALAAVAIVYAVVVCASHAAFNIFDDAGLTCKSVGSPVNVPDAGVLISFRPSALCYASGYKVARLEKYLVWLNPDPAKLAKYAEYQNVSQSSPLDQVGPLANGRIATGPSGYSTFHNNEGEELSWYETVKHVVLTPLRRELFRPWFQMVARYGVSGGEEDFLDPDPDPKVKDISEIMQPQIRGELFFYVNDAVVGFPGLFGALYNDNQGCISVFIHPR